MTAQWSELDKGSEQLILVGPLRNIALEPAITANGLEGIPQIAVDGGSRAAVKPILWAGDGDSGRAPTGTPAFTKTSQDITDFRFCLSGIRDWRWSTLHLFGFLGERRDHELGCFGEIHTEMKARTALSKAIFYGNDNIPHVYFCQTGEHALALQGTFSVLVLEPAEISISGDCSFKAEKIRMTMLSGQGISNEGSGKVRISATGPFMVLSDF